MTRRQLHFHSLAIQRLQSTIRFDDTNFSDGAEFDVIFDLSAAMLADEGEGSLLNIKVQIVIWYERGDDTYAKNDKFKEINPCLSHVQ